VLRWCISSFRIFFGLISFKIIEVQWLNIYQFHQICNGAVFKRLGFILEKIAPAETDLIEKCRTKLTSGNAKLDLQQRADKLITRWRLWVPKAWAKES